MNRLTIDVTKGLLDAASQVGFANISMGVYRLAEHKGDKATMDRAMGYAADAVGNATKSAGEVKDALQEAQAKDTDEIKAQEKAALERRKAESGGTVREPGAGDTMEISTEGRARAGAGPVISEAEGVPSQESGAAMSQGETAAPKMNIHA